jgi:hypothetical protein
MSTVESGEMVDVLDRVKTWSAPQRLTLVRRILETLEASAAGPTNGDRPPEGPTRGWPVEKALGLLKTDREPPDDAECRRIVEEERWKKYGS